MPGFALNEKLEFFVKRPNVSRVVGFFFPRKCFFRVHSSILSSSGASWCSNP